MNLWLRPAQRRTRPAPAASGVAPASYGVLGHRSLSHGLLSLWQFWLMVDPRESLDSPVLAAAADDVLQTVRALASFPDLSALCVVFYTGLDLEACLGCHEWAPGGEWNRAHDLSLPRSWRRLPFEKFDPNN